MTPEEAAVMTPVFNYGGITEQHQEAAVEIANLIAESGNPILAELVKQRFKVVEVPRYDINLSPFIDACKEAGVFAAVQGYMQEGSGLEKMEYPLVSICEDIRKLEKLIPAIKNLP
jgi:hypothetical protein